MSKILIVDDEDDVRLALERRLTREGYEVQTAGSQDAAIATILAATPPFDLVLTDMLMENANSGVDVMRAAFERDVFTEVLILTAYGNIANAVECMKMGAFDYVEKNIPGVDVFELICMKVEQGLERRRSAITTVRRLENLQQLRGTLD